MISSECCQKRRREDDEEGDDDINGNSRSPSNPSFDASPSIFRITERLHISHGSQLSSSSDHSEISNGYGGNGRHHIYGSYTEAPK